jgi:hypothetical protein
LDATGTPQCRDADELERYSSRLVASVSVGERDAPGSDEKQ